MTQPKYAPITEDAEVRPAYRLDPPAPWTPHRPAEFVRSASGRSVRRAGAGVPGPDQGYALLLAGRFEDRLVLASGELSHDVLAGAVVIALRRAALFGRAPVAADLELALTVFGFLDKASDDLVEFRRRLFDGAAHEYWGQRELAFSVPEATLGRSVAEVNRSLEADPGSWRGLAAS